MSLEVANLIPLESVVSPLSMLYKWESEKPDALYMTQPKPGEVLTYTWKETATEARKVAAALLAKNYPKGSRIAILSKNCAHWMIVDLGIMMAGHISVPIFSTAGKETISYVLEHANCPLIFIGKLDNMQAQEDAVPDSVV
jgi:long-subunit acyl-CoA synthetase (AMP-forming)